MKLKQINIKIQLPKAADLIKLSKVNRERFSSTESKLEIIIITLAEQEA